LTSAEGKGGLNFSRTEEKIPVKRTVMENQETKKRKKKGN